MSKPKPAHDRGWSGFDDRFIPSDRLIALVAIFKFYLRLAVMVFRVIYVCVCVCRAALCCCHPECFSLISCTGTAPSEPALVTPTTRYHTKTRKNPSPSLRPASLGSHYLRVWLGGAASFFFFVVFRLFFFVRFSSGSVGWLVALSDSLAVHHDAGHGLYRSENRFSGDQLHHLDYGSDYDRLVGGGGAPGVAGAVVEKPLPAPAVLASPLLLDAGEPTDPHRTSMVQFAEDSDGEQDDKETGFVRQVTKITFFIDFSKIPFWLPAFLMAHWLFGSFYFRLNYMCTIRTLLQAPSGHLVGYKKAELRQFFL